jgi:hypothetical protein
VVIALAVVVLCIAFLLLVVLSLMREIELLRGEVAAVTTLVKNPPPPSFIGDVAPARMKQVIERELSCDTGSSRQILAFVTPSCGPCENLVSGMAVAIRDGRLNRDDILFAIFALPLSGWEQWSRKIPARAIADIEGRLAGACEVRATPAMFVISRHDWKVLDFNLEGEAEWAISRLSPAVMPPLTMTSK